MDLVVIFGPPAVGKTTVGVELSRLTGWPLFHNHLTIEAVLPVFGFDHPAFWPLIVEFRRRVFEEAVANDLPGLIYTFAWSINDPNDRAYIDCLQSLVAGKGGRVYFAELAATLDERIRRNEHAGRLATKPSKRDLAASRKFLSETAGLTMNTSGTFWYPERHVRIENTDVSADLAAEHILHMLGLPRRASGSNI